jgi:hypothetical protein
MRPFNPILALAAATTAASNAIPDYLQAAPPSLGHQQQFPVMPPPHSGGGGNGGNGGKHGDDRDGNNGGGGGSDPPTQNQPGVALTDILGTQRSITTFFSLARQHAALSDLLADLRANTTVLAPLNSAVEALPRKPWEHPRDAGDADAYDGDDGRDRAQRNLRRFVEAHLLTASPWPEGREHGAAKTVEGEEGGKARELWWEWRGDTRVIMPDGVEVERIASRVANGEVVRLL